MCNSVDCPLLILLLMIFEITEVLRFHVLYFEETILCYVSFVYSFPLLTAVCQTPVVDNGKVTPTNTTFMEGDQLQVTCNDGYSLEEGFISPSVCLSNGTWNRVPTCTPDGTYRLLPTVS